MIKIFCISEKTERVIFQYTAPVAPKEGEIIYGSHQGAFIVTRVVHNISDDRNKFDNELLWVECLLKKKED